MICDQIWDRPDGTYLAYIDASDKVISTRRGTIGSRKDRKLYDLDNNLICALCAYQFFQSMVEGQAVGCSSNWLAGLSSKRRPATGSCRTLPALHIDEARGAYGLTGARWEGLP